jgi:copper homeostasis protein
MNTGYLLEVCVTSTKAARTAEAGGADRVELCDQLSIGGVTPAIDLIEATVRAVEIPVHVLIRPRGGDFRFSSAEFAGMRAEIEEAGRVGAAGVVIGVLLPDGRVDIERTRKLAELAAPMKITFHRAFDEIRDQEAALEDVILTGADCLLTSGGAMSALAGATRIAGLRRLAGDRLDVMAGAGVRAANILELLRRTGVRYVHGSLLRKAGHGMRPHEASGRESPVEDGELLEEDVRRVVDLLNRGLRRL